MFPKFKPMLACDCSDISQVNFPILASSKLDGIRSTKVIDNLIFVEVYSSFGCGLANFVVFYKEGQITMQIALELGWDI